MNPAVQAASEAAWKDEVHVRENRRLYAEKFRAALPVIRAPLAVSMPDAGFYFWIATPLPDTEFARELYRAYNVSVLPGSFLAREAQGENPGRNFVRVALVAGHDECLEAIARTRGEAFYRAATAERGDLARRFLFITGDTANPKAWKFLEEAGVPVLEKPFSADALLRAVQELTA